MQKTSLWLWCAMLGAMVITFSGCGGGGTSTETFAGSVGVFVTDQFDTQYTQVVFTLYRVEVGRQGDPGSFRTVFEEPAGLALDVRALSNLAQLLGVGTLPAGVYNRARLTVASQIQVTLTSGSTATLNLDAGVGNSVGNGQLQFEFPIELTVVASGNTNLIIDFDLPNFSIVNGLVRPALRHLHENEMSHRPRHAELRGSVTALGDNQFSLQLPNGRVIQVQTTAQTVIVSEHGGTPTLAVGQQVEVEGVVDPVNFTITAQRVKIKDSNDHIPSLVEVKGIVTNIGSGEFRVRIKRGHHFNPESAEVTVIYNDQTRWFQDGGQPTSADQLQVGMEVEVKGSLNASGQIDARYIELKFEDD